MDEESSGEAGFKVVDRRRFTEEGDAKSSEVESVAKESPKPAPAKPGLAKSGPAAAAESKPAAPQAAEQVAPKGAATEEGDPRAGTVDFPSFVISLATQAMMMMGEIPNPETNLLNENIEGARQTIDILALLEEKTQGNLTAEEAQLMTEVLASLRMGYVNKRGA